MPDDATVDFAAPSRRLTAAGAASPLEWSLPEGFLSRGRPPLTYHGRPDRWSAGQDRVSLGAVARGQEFVLDLKHTELNTWLAEVIAGAAEEW